MGASIDFSYVASHAWLVMLLVAGLIVIKAAALWLLSLTSGIAADQQSLFALSLAQGGEFAFVLVSFCTQAGVCWGRA